MSYFVLFIDGVRGVAMSTRSAFSTLEAAEAYMATVHAKWHPFIVREIKEFQS